MKKVLTLFQLFSLSASAGILNGHHSIQDLITKRMCSVQECKLQDNGQKFLSICENSIPPLNGWLRTLDIYEGANFSCYCPCELGFIGQAKKSN